VEQEPQGGGRRVSAYPLVLTRLDQMRCVVVGGGAVAERKVGELIAGGGTPTVISPTLTPQLAEWAAGGQIEHLARAYQPGDVQHAALLIAATSDRSVNAQIAAAAPAGCLLNVADDPAAGTMHTVASVRRGDLLLTVSTGGSSPSLTAQIRRELATAYGQEYAAITRLFGRWRTRVTHHLAPAARQEFWHRLRSAVQAGNAAEFETRAVEIFETLSADVPRTED
jgi:siroheme synthase-like protein